MTYRRSRLALRGSVRALALLVLVVAGSGWVLLDASQRQARPERPQGLTLPSPTAVPEVPKARHAGVPRIIDGDTLDVAGARYRIAWIDAPERSQTCTRAGQLVELGRESTTALDRLIGGAPVTCSASSRDPYGRWVGVCTVDGVDVGAAQVLSGHAIAFRRYSEAYVPHESAAREAGRGLWACDSHTAPADFRRSR